VSSLVPSGPSDALGYDLEARGADLARLDTELTAFKIRYRHEVGRLHEQLDELELAIAEAELGEINRKLADADGGATASATSPRPAPAARLTSDAVRKLFRDVAKVIHPDLAGDPHARDHRHRLMVEANRAYALGDEQRLRSILEAWERSPEAVPGDDARAVRERLVRRIAQLEEQLALCARELADVHDSPLWKLKTMVDEASSRGKDLVRDMVKRLKRDILAAQNRLDAMRDDDVSSR
jgi:hypothetical protein